MASMRDIKRRKESIQSTQQITKAMKLVSTVKLQKARTRAESAKPYFQKMYDTVQSILERLECRQVEALGDLEEGVPVCAAQTRLGTLHLVTKSGGLGSASVVPGIIQYFTGGI